METLASDCGGHACQCEEKIEVPSIESQVRQVSINQLEDDHLESPVSRSGRDESTHFAAGDAHLSSGKVTVVSTSTQTKKPKECRYCSPLTVEPFVKSSPTKQEINKQKARICKGANFSKIKGGKKASNVKRPSVVVQLTGIPQACSPRVPKANTKKNIETENAKVENDDTRIAETENAESKIAETENDDTLNATTQDRGNEVKKTDDQDKAAEGECDDFESNDSKTNVLNRPKCNGPAYKISQLNLIERPNKRKPKVNPSDWVKRLYPDPTKLRRQSRYDRSPERRCQTTKLPQITAPPPSHAADTETTICSRRSDSAPLTTLETFRITSPYRTSENMLVSTLPADVQYLKPMTASVTETQPQSFKSQDCINGKGGLQVCNRFPDNFIGCEEADEQLEHITENSNHLPALKKLVTERKIITYKELRNNAKVYLPLKLPGFETNPQMIQKMKKDILIVMRRHDQALFQRNYPPMIVPRYLHLLKKGDEPVCLGASTHAVIAQAQSQSTETVYAVKYFRKGTRGVCEYLRDMVREAAVQHTAHRLLPNMVPRVKGFVAIHDPTATFLPCGLVSEFIPMVDGSLNPLSISTAMHMQSDPRSSLFRLDMWLDLMRQIINSFKVLADNEITHNDMKANNILLKVEDDAIRPVIIDFGHGLCRERDVDVIHAYAPSENRIPELLNKYRQMAPELLLKRRVSNNSDVYGVGMIFVRLGSVLKLSMLSELGEEMREWHHEVRMDWSSVETLMVEILQALEDAKTTFEPAEIRQTMNSPVSDANMKTTC